MAESDEYTFKTVKNTQGKGGIREEINFPEYEQFQDEKTDTGKAVDDKTTGLKIERVK